MSRRVNKERTRNRLLQAVLKIIHRNGLGALTTGKAAQLAGVAQPTFYVHFKSMDEALEQVGSLVSEQLRAAFRSTPEANPDRAAEAVADAVKEGARALVRDRKVAEVFLRTRRDATIPMGRQMMSLTDDLRASMLALVQQVRGELSPLDAQLHTELLVSTVFGLSEAYLDRRVIDLDRAARIASRAILVGIAQTAPVADAA